MTKWLQSRPSRFRNCFCTVAKAVKMKCCTSIIKHRLTCLMFWRYESNLVRQTRGHLAMIKATKIIQPCQCKGGDSDSTLEAPTKIPTICCSSLMTTMMMAKKILKLVAIATRTTIKMMITVELCISRLEQLRKNQRPKIHQHPQLYFASYAVATTKISKTTWKRSPNSLAHREINFKNWKAMRRMSLMMTRSIQNFSHPPSLILSGWPMTLISLMTMTRMMKISIKRRRVRIAKKSCLKLATKTSQNWIIITHKIIMISHNSNKLQRVAIKTLKIWVKRVASLINQFPQIVKQNLFKWSQNNKTHSNQGIIKVRNLQSRNGSVVVEAVAAKIRKAVAMTVAVVSASTNQSRPIL